MGCTVDIPSKHFRVYVNWLYQDEIEEGDIKDDTHSGPSDVWEQSVMWLVELHVIGVRLNDEQFQDCVMTEMYKLFVKSESETGFVVIADRLLSDSPADSKPRQLLVDWIVQDGVVPDNREDTDMGWFGDENFFRK